MDLFLNTHPNEQGLPSSALLQFSFLGSESCLKAGACGPAPSASKAGGGAVEACWSCHWAQVGSPSRIPRPPHLGTQGRGGVKTWRAFAGFPWACDHLLSAHTQLATFDPTKFELKWGWWVRSSSLRCRSGRGGGGMRKEEQRFMASRLIKKKLGDDTAAKYFGWWVYPGKGHIVVQMRHLPSTFSEKEPKHFALWRHTALKSVKSRIRLSLA